MLMNIVQHLFEGLAICISIYLVTRPNMSLKEIVTMTFMISLVIIILDLFAPKIAFGARKGAGFGIGLAQVGAGDQPDTSAGPISNVPDHIQTEMNLNTEPHGVADRSVSTACPLVDVHKPLAGQDIPIDIKNASIGG